ncbi:MAG: hypothetical protein ACE5KM_09625 [Planctomycetaceae bacterium]
MASFDDWQDKHKTKEFPNSRGSSDASIESLRENWWPDDHGEYMYVPGLRSDDPPNLVLMYLAKPTRWQWHAETRWIFREKEWIVIPVDFTFLRDGVRDGELNERLSTDEFRRRLKKTLEFLRTNKRPHWEAVAQEHTGFLNTIKRDAD